MKRTKTSYFVCTHKIIQLFILAFFTKNLIAQELNFDNWSHYTDTTYSKNKLYNLNEDLYYLISFENKKTIDNCYKKGIILIKFLDNHNAIVKSTNNLLTDLNIIYYKRANNLWKLSNLKSTNPDVIQRFIIKTSNVPTLKQQLYINDIKLVSENDYFICVSTSLYKIKKHILPLKKVTYIGNECLKPTHESPVKDLNLSVNNISKALKLYPSLSGHNQIIGLKDNAPNSNDIDLLEKIESSNLISETIDEHATDMATIIAGRGNSGSNANGVQALAKIFPIDFNELTPNNLTNTKVSLINNSYGTTIENYYGILASAYDQFLFENPTKFHIFSSGNSGDKTSENGVYQKIPNYANITGNFKMSKNSISVGAIDQDGNIQDFSSKGPAHDGRIKPEIVAYSDIGTSNATAIVTGVASMLQQVYLNSENTLPPSSLIKASLLNGANDIGQAGIDFKSGFGNLNAVESLKIINAKQYIIDTIKNQETRDYEINIPSNAKNIKVMLVWTDTPAQPGDNIALKNNLDLTLKNSTKTYYPSILNSNAIIEDLESKSTTGIDNLNPVEQVLIKNSSDTKYTIRINAKQLITQNQLFSIVYSWKINNNFEWNYPLKNENLPYNGSNEGYIRWKYSFGDSTATTDLEINYGNTNKWETIANKISLNKGFYKWVLTEHTHTEAQLRLKINNTYYTSEKFKISNGLNIQNNLNCENSAEIKWNKKENTESYNIYNLQNNKMTLIKNSKDTIFSFPKKLFTKPYFSIKPVLKNKVESLQSNTISIENANERCYFSSFFAELNSKKRIINLSISLSSTYDLKLLELYRINKDKSATKIHEITELNLLGLSIYDTKPINGLNNYQIKAITKDGTVHYSSIANTLYFSPYESYLVYPNPTTIKSGINIFSGINQKSDFIFELYSLDGELVLTKKLTSDRVFIELNSIKKGLYIYKIKKSSEDSGYIKKILIQ